jgi:minor extracellular serine protease Vpr
VLALAAVAVAAIGLTGASAATGQHGRFQTIPGGTLSSSSSKFVPLALSNKPVTYILEMSAKPVAAVVAASKLAGHHGLGYAQKTALTRQIRAQQAPVIAAVSRLHGALVTHQYQGVYNGIAVTLPQREAWKLSSIKGVKAVFASQTHTMASIAPGNGIPLVNAPQTWSGFNGTGTKIADLDTGLDYTHADFGGTGTTAAFACASAHSTEDLATFQASCPGVTDWVTGTKVKGGTDFVGDAYNAAGSGPALIPHPDPNPLDCNGHGSHTAGTAAGYGVDAAGNTYSGSYDANTFTNTSFNIPPGVAPKADLYGVRVFGCSGSVDDAVLLDAMNWAFVNGMDVVNMSLGSSFGSNSDPDAAAVNNLSANGVIVVMSSGNAGNNPYMTG